MLYVCMCVHYGVCCMCVHCVARLCVSVIRLGRQVLMDRYGEDYNLLNLPSWVREAQEEEEEEEEEERMRAELGKGEVELSVLEQWVLRRSDAGT